MKVLRIIGEILIALSIVATLVLFFYLLFQFNAEYEQAFRSLFSKLNI